VAAFVAAVIRRDRLRATYIVVIERIDGDGIARMRPVHPDASEAILVAAGMQQPTQA